MSSNNPIHPIYPDEHEIKDELKQKPQLCPNEKRVIQINSIIGRLYD